MGRSNLKRLSREQLIELVLRLQRPDRTSRTSSKPPSTNRKVRREQAKSGHEGHSCVMSEDPDAVVKHRPDRCACCGGALHEDLSAEVVSVSERIELPVFLAHPGSVEPTNDGSARLLRSSIIQPRMTNGYRAMWAAEGEADIRTVVDTACLTGTSPFATILKTVSA